MNVEDPRMFQFFYPDTPDIPLTQGHTFPASKYRLFRLAAIDEGVIPRARTHASPQVTREDLLRVHSAGYVDAVLSASLDEMAVRRLGLPLSDILITRALASVGSSLAAARAAMSQGYAAGLSGGTHHAHRDFGSGFCVFNDLAVVARTFLDEASVGRISILDCDVHQGDGTAALTASEPRVQTVDMFGDNNFPARKVDPDVAFRLPNAMQDAAYLSTLDEALAAISQFAPGLMLYNAGVDPLYEDRLGRLSLSLEGLMERDRRVFAFARANGIPVVSVAGGGYAQPVELTVTAYVNTLRAAKQVFGF